MRACFLAIFLLPLMDGLLTADTREVVRMTVAGTESVYAQFVQGKNIRTETYAPGGLRQVSIQHRGQNVIYQLDPASKEYVEYGSDQVDAIESLARWLTRPPRIRNSGKTVDVYYETLDTGERQEFFGRTARHLILRERRVAHAGACGVSQERKSDGWYFPVTEDVSYRLVATITGSGEECRDRVVQHGTPARTGMAVLETSGLMTRQVLELSDEHLEASLFEIPGGFRRVDALPGMRRMSWFEQVNAEWKELELAVGSWFR